MKKKNLMLCVVLLAIGATAFKIADDIITRLGMEHRNAQNNIVKNLLGRFSTGPMQSYIEDDPNNAFTQHNSFQIPYAKLLANVITGDKAEAAQDLCKYVRTYVNSEEFITEYNRLKEDAMPLLDMGSSLPTLRGNKIVYEKNIKNYKTDTKYVAEQQKEMDENQKRIDALLEASKKPFAGKDVWEKAYPADPTLIIKKRLQEYLTLAATVDFKATLSGSGKKQVFTNAVYEKRSLKWKAIYRAGKEVNDVVTAFVKDWMKGEIIAK